jgi:hypothetical protein
MEVQFTAYTHLEHSKKLVSETNTHITSLSIILRPNKVQA